MFFGIDKQVLTLVFDKTIKFCFFSLFLLVPLILTPWNYELFEYNKMMAVYALTVIIVASWLGKMILLKKIFIAKTPLDLPLVLFLFSQVISSTFSIDPHVSWWGYYSRFNGGLLSTMSYILLYYAFTANFSEGLRKLSKPEHLKVRGSENQLADKSGSSDNLINRFSGLPSHSEFSEIRILLLLALCSGLIISLYAILEHFGHSPSCLMIIHTFDTSCWVQDVQNRVFATLGQPNWLAAYLAILIPLGLGMLNWFYTLNTNTDPRMQNLKREMQNNKAKFKKNLFKNFTFYFLLFTFYIALLFTRSRSGFLGFLAADLMFWAFFIIPSTKFTLSAKRHFIFFHLILIALTIIILRETLHPQPEIPTNQIAGPVLESGGTESGEIRKIVWTGAVDITRHYPLFGTGVETFAFAYYRFRPAQHNLTSEWDYLYNKAHNEYLNYGATTGLVGLGTYTLLLLSFGWWYFRILNQESRIKNQGRENTSYFIIHGLFAGWLSILVTNFFGFSVVVIALFFYLLPAMAFVLTGEAKLTTINVPVLARFFARKKPETNISKTQLAAMAIVVLTATLLLFSLYRLWIADTHFASAVNLSKDGQYAQAYPEFRRALELNFQEPLYHDEFGATLGYLASLASMARESSLSAELASLAVAASDKAISISPNNITFWKTRTRIFNSLADIDEAYNQNALDALSEAQALAPTDAKIMYNKGLLLFRLKRQDEAIVALQKAIALKSNYRDPHFALAAFYQENADNEEAKKELETILGSIDPNDQEAKKMLEELKKK